MELSRRLMAVASAVTEGNRLADIGTDHGYIPIYLILKGIVPSAIAMDVNRGPLDRADAHIREYGLEDKIETRLSDGLAQLDAHETDTIVIAGMGGALMCEILGRGGHVIADGKELILQPQSELFKVRRFLHEHGYRIRSEQIVKEEGKYYFILQAIPGTEIFDSDFLYDYGEYLLKNHDPLMREYLEWEMRKCRTISEQLADQHSESAAARRQDMKEWQDKLEKAYHYEM